MTEDAVNHYGNLMSRNRSEQSLGRTVVDSQHIPYDAATMAMIRRLKEAKNKVQPEYPDPLEELRRLKDIDVNALKNHIDKTNRHKSQQQLKLIRELNEVKNHQAFWVHNQKRLED